MPPLRRQSTVRFVTSRAANRPRERSRPSCLCVCTYRCVVSDVGGRRRWRPAAPAGWPLTEDLSLTLAPLNGAKGEGKQSHPQSVRPSVSPCIHAWRKDAGAHRAPRAFSHTRRPCAAFVTFLKIVGFVLVGAPTGFHRTPVCAPPFDVCQCVQCQCSDAAGMMTVLLNEF